MAGSRLPNFGTIFSRVTGLLETGATKEVPLWYNVYKKYPPEVEPCSERDMPPQPPIPELVYEEDFARANKSNVKDFTDTGGQPKSGQATKANTKVSDIINI